MDDKDKKSHKFSFRVPSLRFGGSFFSRISFPSYLRPSLPFPSGIYLGGGKLILVSLTAVGIGFLASMFLLISSGEQQIQFPMLGASYTAPDMVGTRLVDREFPDEVSQTLRINVPAGIRLDEIRLTNISLGKSGLTDAFQIVGTSTTDSIIIDDLIIRNSEFPTFDIANANIYTITATSSVIASGHTFETTMSTGTDITIGSGRGAASYIASDMVVDRIIIQQSSAGGDVIIDKVILDGVRAWTGGMNIDYVDIGTLLIEDLRVGDDADINTSEFLIHDSVTANTVNDGVIERPIVIR